MNSLLLKLKLNVMHQCRYMHYKYKYIDLTDKQIAKIHVN